jgi:hypothetical protein
MVSQAHLQRGYVGSSMRAENSRFPFVPRPIVQRVRLSRKTLGHPRRIVKFIQVGLTTHDIMLGSFRSGCLISRFVVSSEASVDSARPEQVVGKKVATKKLSQQKPAIVANISGVENLHNRQPQASQNRAWELCGFTSTHGPLPGPCGDHGFC